MLLDFAAGPIGKLLLLKLLFGEGGAEPSEAPAVPATPFPVAKPAGLPPYPGPGWCPDLPPPPEVIARGWQLLPTLWAKGEGTFQTEMVGGRYITFQATSLLGQKAVAAYRSTNCEVIPTAPPVMPPATPNQALIDKANVMNEALKIRGYKKSDMHIYQDFQRAAGLLADGYPGTVTMLKLETVLKSAGYGMAPVRVYPWKAGAPYDGVNAPTTSEWEGTGVPKTSPIATAATATATRAVPSSAPPIRQMPPIVPAAYKPAPAASPAPAPAAAYSPSSLTNKDVQHDLNVLGYKGADGSPLKEDGIIGPQSKFAIRAFQKDHPPLAIDSIAGPQTKSMLAAAVSLQNAIPSGPSYIPAATTPTAPTVSSNVDVQHALNRLGYAGKDSMPLKEDGIIGPNSKYAIASFQREHPPLAVDSVAGPQTKARLSQALLAIAA